MKKSINSLTSDITVLFATFSAWDHGKRLPTNGSVEPLRDFLVPKILKLVLIDQIVPGCSNVMPVIEEYRNRSIRAVIHAPSWILRLMKPLLFMTNRSATVVSFKIRDFISVIDWALLRDRTKYDYFIGLESINALAGIVLRTLGCVKRVIYYVSDYSPNRYPNKLFNRIYLWLDRFAAMHSDYIWDVSLAMQPARYAAGLDPHKSAPVIHVANGLFKQQIRIDPLSRIKPHAIAYMGTVGSENGPDVAIEALSILKKRYPDAALHIIGGKQNDFAWLVPLIRRLKLNESVIHYGFIPKPADMAKILRRCSVGVAPYRAFPGSPRYYGDAGKIRAYCASGLPVVSSQVPPLGVEVAHAGAALIASDNPVSFADAITRIFSDKDLYIRLRSNAQKFAQYNTWDNQFAQAFHQMANYEKSKAA